MIFTVEEANKFWDILVAHGGALERERPEFINYFTSDEDFKEYRFRGLFGFGGKIKQNFSSVYVAFYSEDYTTEREILKQKINALLSEIVNKRVDNSPLIN